MVTLLCSVLTISSDQLLETKQSDEQGDLRLFSGGFYFVYMSSFFMVSIFLSQWSAMNIAGTSCPFLRPHSSSFLWDVRPLPSRSEDHLQDTSAMFFVADWNRNGELGFLYLEEKQFHRVVKQC